MKTNPPPNTPEPLSDQEYQLILDLVDLYDAVWEDCLTYTPIVQEAVDKAGEHDASTFKSIQDKARKQLKL